MAYETLFDALAQMHTCEHKICIIPYIQQTIAHESKWQKYFNAFPAVSCKKLLTYKCSVFVLFRFSPTWPGLSTDPFPVYHLLVVTTSYEKLTFSKVLNYAKRQSKRCTTLHVCAKVGTVSHNIFEHRIIMCSPSPVPLENEIDAEKEVLFSFPTSFESIMILGLLLL